VSDSRQPSAATRESGAAVRVPDRFDPAPVGLDHLGFHVADRQQLEAWRVRLDEQGVTNSGIIEDEAGLHLNAKDPDNIALEFFYMPPQG
jgi:glyoxylase I family protein